MTGTQAAPAFRTVAPRIHRIDLPLGERYASLYLVTGDDACLLFDAGVSGMIGDYVIPTLSVLGVDPADVRHVLLSHCDVDHFGGAADARAAFPEAQLIAHELDAPAMEDFATYVAERADGFGDFGWSETPETLAWARSVTAEAALDATVCGGEQIELGGIVIEVLHVPGHSSGHLALWEPASRTVLVSDAVLGRSVDLADGTPAFPPTYRFVDEYLSSVRAIESLHAHTLLTAHYPTMTGDEVQAFLDASRDFAAELDDLVLTAVKEADGVSFEGILAKVNPIAGDWPEEGTLGALAYPVAGHLERLETRGAVRSDGIGRDRTWRA